MGYVVLGLIRANVTTGYAIAEVFKHTPMRAFSSSPGSIYPAVRRLREAGLVCDAPSDADAKLRLKLSERGLQVFLDWLKRPVDVSDVEHGSEELLLRFAFMSGEMPDAMIASFLAEFRAGLALHAEQIAAFERTAAHMTLTGRLALEAGRMRLAAYIEWCDRGVRLFKKDQTRDG